MLAELIILPPFLAATLVGLGILTGRIEGETHEKLTSRLAFGAVTISLCAVVAAIAMRLSGLLADTLILGNWMESGDYRIDLSFDFERLNLTFASLVAFISILVLRFSIHYMHREAGFHRFFLVLSLFVGAMLLLALGGNAALTFAGWEMAGVSSYLLIAYAYDRPVAAANATRAFVTNRIGDAGFVLGIFLAFAWTGGIDWSNIASRSLQLPQWQADVLAGCFLLAAIAKSAQVPLVPWLARAMEGPTPSSAIFYGAVMIHAGIFLMLRLQPVLEQAPLTMAFMAVVGLMTALYGFVCGLSQTDVKSALIFSTSGQVGLMFLEGGLGFWDLALWHLCSHAVFRGYQFLTAPSLMHEIVGSPNRPVPKSLANHRLFYVASLQRLWLENLGDWLVVKPMQRLGRDLSVFDRQVVHSAVGLPIRPSTEEEREREPGSADPDVIRVSGFAGRCVAVTANWLHWFEDRLVLKGVEEELLRAGRRLGVRLNRFEALLNEPRYLIIFILATLLAVF